jgi:hypothetical protein
MDFTGPSYILMPGCGITVPPDTHVKIVFQELCIGAEAGRMDVAGRELYSAPPVRPHGAASRPPDHKHLRKHHGKSLPYLPHSVISFYAHQLSHIIVRATPM